MIDDAYDGNHDDYFRYQKSEQQQNVFFWSSKLVLLVTISAKKFTGAKWATWPKIRQLAA